MARQKTAAYRPTPTNPNIPVEPQVREQHSVDLDDFMDEIDDILQQEEEFAVNYRQRGGQ